jgi:isopenicillin-N N-acyltransferase-like protein
MVRRTFVSVFGLAALLLWSSAPTRADSKTIARCGAGFLEEVDGYKVLHVKGTPYEMGYQQGVLLKDDIRPLVRYLFDVKAKEFKVDLVPGLTLNPNPKLLIATISESQKKHVPKRYYDELRGVADGSGCDYNEIVVANFLPELFHCSGFALSGSATKDGSLYHGRILDYGCDWGLQDHAVLTIFEPEGKIPFANVSYAGFIGSVTGMNAEKVSIGEMGGKGLGHWDGVPMTFLVRWALEEAKSLDEAIAIFRDHPRTCEYYYVIADGKTGRGVGMEASWNKFFTVAMGESHEKLPTALKDAVVLSAGDRYKELARRVKAGHGTFDADSARHLMDRPVAMKSNLHSVLFESTTTKLWIANASKSGEPASNQPYHAFQLSELLKHNADTSAPALPCPKAHEVKAAATVGAR